MRKFSSDANLYEKQFLLSAERGDLESVRKLLEIYKSTQTFSINCLDPLRRSALHIAIENDNIELIELLLDYNISTGDSILYAIIRENVEVVEILLEHLEKIGKFTPETQGVEINTHSAFTSDMTPIILAAHKDSYECIKLLLDKKATILHPHDVQCLCKDCVQAKAEDSLCFSRSRINTYQALTSPSLICLSSKDPILYAFELSYELRRLSYIENEFRNEYQELSRKCQAFSVNMLEQVRGSKELEIVLNHTTNAWEDVTEKKSANFCQKLARLKLAIKLRQKIFVAHPNCQQLLSAIFYEGLPGFRDRHIVTRMLIILGVSITSPLLAIIYLIAPKSSFGKFARRPFIKFLSHSVSYCFFLFLIILANQRINLDLIFGKNSTSLVHDEYPDLDRKEVRGPPPTFVELAILVWVFGLVWVEIKQLWNEGLCDYCSDLWNILDFVTNSLYLCTIALRIVAYSQVEAEIRNPQMRHLGRHIIRRNWDEWEPTLISECAFATANIFSSLKIIHIFTVNPHLGPLRISLGRMVLDIVKFLLIYFLVLFSFACGLNQLLWYYSVMRHQECEKYHSLINNPINDIPISELNEMKDSCDEKYWACESLYNSMETLFWSSFGIIVLEQLDIVESHGPTRWTGRTILGCYCCCSVIVLLNMLIAMMSNSYQDIYNQADVEWKFARSKLWIEYFDDSATLPPPFNMIPSPKSLYYCIRWCLESICQSNRTTGFNFRSIRNQKILKTINKRENNYRFVMRNLVKRYIAQSQRCKQQTEGITEDDVAEIKEDISAFRYELLSILQNAGFNIGHTNFRHEMISRGKRRNLTAERRVVSEITESISIPMPERLLNDTSDDDEEDESHEVDRKERRGLPVPTQAVKFASKLKKVLPHTRTKDVIIKTRFARNARTGLPSIKRGLETNLNALINVHSLPADIKSSKVTRPRTKLHDIRSTEDDDEDLELVVDSGDDDIVDNDEEDNISESGAESNEMKRKLRHFSKEAHRYHPDSICLEMDCQEDTMFNS
ncbi:Transient receptor potential-gamma protein [Dirofilaria immitis]